MRRRSTIAAVLAALAMVGAAPATHAAKPTSVHAACTSAVIEGKHKCIARGQFCRHTKKANRDYHKYGYHCGKKDKNGRYHLVYY